MIDRETVDRILDAADIVDVISDFVTLRRRGANRRGANYIACCPFHNEKTPSFSVSPSKGIFKCFGCGKAGSAVTFIMEHEQMTYPEALKYLARKYGIEVHEQEETQEDAQDRLKRESMMAGSVPLRDIPWDCPISGRSAASPRRPYGNSGWAGRLPADHLPESRRCRPWQRLR